METLRKFGQKKGFETIVAPAKQIQLPSGKNMRVSSTLIRYMLEGGHVAEALHPSTQAIGSSRVV